MALTIVDRPRGQFLGTTPNQATVDNVIIAARFTKTAHGLITGNHIYVVSNVRDYCGFWYVVVGNANQFQLRYYQLSDYVQYINDDTITYYVASTAHNWSAVHLPITYKITSTLWPVNSEDTIRTVLSAVASFGYTKLTLSGDIKATGSANELDFVKFTVNGIEGIYQILQWISDTNFVIDLTFLGTNVYGNIQFYYNNYHARIKVYAGLTALHKWVAQKPYEYIAEIKEVPDSGNMVVVNINEYLKSQINILTNDLLLGTLPNDINSFCQFYITVAESYDISLDGYTIGSYLSAYADDSVNLEAVACNAELPFKNRYSGYMSEYVINAKFLTLFDQPTMFNGYYFEIDIIIDELIAASIPITLVQETYKNGVFQATYNTVISNFANNYGVFRVALTVKGNEDQQHVYIKTGLQVSETKTINVNQECGSQAMEFIWKNYLGGHDTFVFTSQKDYGIDISGTKESKKSIMGNWPDSYGENADTINREIERTSNESVTIYSQNITETEINGLKYLKTSPLVQIINTKFDKRTVIIDKSSFVVKKDGDKTYSLTFKASYTDDVPSQSL